MTTNWQAPPQLRPALQEVYTVLFWAWAGSRGNDVLSILFSSALPPRLFPSRRKGISNANRDGETLYDTTSVNAYPVDLHPPQEGPDPCRGRPGFEESS